MEFSRREFIRSAFLWGGAFFLKELVVPVDAGSSTDWLPAYAKLAAEGDLNERVRQAYALFEACTLCPRECGADRVAGETGYCRATAKVKVYSAQPHLGEEKSLTGRRGSGTIFFSNCNLRCVFCQNWPIAHKGHGEEITDDDLAQIMLRLQAIGCHNINLVTPTHVMPNILSAVEKAHAQGLRIPLVYNTSGYERAEILKLLEDVVDIYLPDMKYMDPQQAAMYSAGADDYPEVTQKAVLEMHRQVGLHRMDERGIAQNGLMIRHLVMPNRVAGTEAFVRWVAENLPQSTYVNIMAQYHVDFKAFEYPEIWRSITVKEYLEAMAWAKQAGLTNLDPDSIRVWNIYLRRGS
jgi:putative pyruvate formate lyase activating enzyme